MSVNSFDAKATLPGGRRGPTRSFGSMPSTVQIRCRTASRSCWRTCFALRTGANITADDIRGLADWDPHAEPSKEIQFTPARVIMQDFTGVPGMVDLAADARGHARTGRRPVQDANPLAPVELVDRPLGDRRRVRPTGRVRARRRARVRAQPRALPVPAWAQAPFDRRSRSCPPAPGIVPPGQHRVPRAGGRSYGPRTSRAYPDTLVGTDSHTPMVNGLGVLGWGVGGIEAEASHARPAGLDAACPQVVGVQACPGELPEGATATDLVLTITEHAAPAQRGRQVRRVLRAGRGRRCRWPTGPPSAT